MNILCLNVGTVKEMPTSELKLFKLRVLLKLSIAQRELHKRLMYVIGTQIELHEIVKVKIYFTKHNFLFC